jgi:hypothetical protein
MLRRYPFKQVNFSKDHPALSISEVRQKAEVMPPGQDREDMLKKARRADVASHLDEWASSPGLRPPK